MAELTDAEIERAMKRGERAHSAEPRAQSASYDPGTRMLVIVMTNGTEVRIPAHLIQGLDSASEKDRAAAVVQGGGYGLHWPSVDLDLSIPGLLAGVCGTRSFMSKMAGQAKSSAKTAAARKNGRRGGRPRKPKAAA